MAADRVIKSVTSWLERKLFLKVSAEKTKVVRPSQSKFPGFTFWKNEKGWQCRPCKEKVSKLYDKAREILKRKRAIAIPLGVTLKKLNQLIRGWINYFRIGAMRGTMEIFGQWLRHKVRVVVIKQWKKPKTIHKNLKKLRAYLKSSYSDDELWMLASNGRGWYQKGNNPIANFLLSPKVLETKKGDRPGLVNPLNYYLKPVH